MPAMLRGRRHFQLAIPTHHASIARVIPGQTITSTRVRYSSKNTKLLIRLTIFHWDNVNEFIFIPLKIIR